jgi:hypothetical protein
MCKLYEGDARLHERPRLARVLVLAASSCDRESSRDGDKLMDLNPARLSRAQNTQYVGLVSSKVRIPTRKHGLSKAMRADL